MPSMEDFVTATYPATFQMAIKKTSGQNYCVAFSEIWSDLRSNTASSARNKR
jgi:hypothetical protein